MLDRWEGDRPRASKDASSNAQDVLIVGAGPAGLACAAAIRHAGLRAVVLERANAVGASWRQHYDRLRLNTSRWFSSLPGARYPPGTKLFPSRDDMIRYLENYVEHHALDIRVSTQVQRIDRDDDEWVVCTPSGVFGSAHVVIATGLNNDPLLPNWAEQARRRVTLIHSSEYRNPDPFVGQAVLVVGAGSSGMEIAGDLAEADVQSVYLSVRTAPNILLRTIGGLPGDPAAMVLLELPPRLADAVLAGIRRVTVGDLRRYGLRRPKEGPFERMQRDGTAPAIVDKQVLDLIRSGRIEVVAGVESFDEQGARLRDGRRLEVDAVIAATGYRPNLEPLVGHLGVLDERGTPRCPSGEEMAPGLRFVGFRPVPGFLGDVGRQAKRLAKEIARQRRAALSPALRT
jgi:putative flavoprotein involved in K+ transport